MATTLYPTSEMRAQALSEQKITLNVKKLSAQPGIRVNSFDFQKDASDSTGDGTLTVLYDHAFYLKINKNDEISFKAGWITPDGKDNSVDYLNGYIKDIKPTGNTLEIDFVDKGVLLEQKATADYHQMKRSDILRDIASRAGLKAEINFGDNPDDVIDYTTESSSDTSNSDSSGDSSGGSSSGGNITITARPSCKYCNKQFGYSWYTTTFVNKCPFCGATLEINPKGVQERELTCSKCGADFCGVCGREKRVPPRARLTIVSSSASGNSSSGSNPTSDSSDSDSDSSDSNDKSFWDMILELIMPTIFDFQVFVWMDTLYVQQVPSPDSAKLWVDEGVNLIEDSVTITDPDINNTNQVTVQYGDSAHPQTVTVKYQDYIDKAGKVIEDKYQKLNYTEEQAHQYATKMLHEKLQKNGFSMDGTAIGGPQWFICRWLKTTCPLYNLDDTYYITRIDSKMDADTPWQVDFTIAEYFPDLSTDKKDDDEAGDINSQDPVKLAKALKTAKAIFDWVKQNIQWVYYENNRNDPATVLKLKRANCDDQSDLLVLMFKTVGYNAWKVCHLHCGRYDHCNVRVVINGQVVTADTSCRALNQM